MNFMPGSERLVCFDEMELGFTEEQAKKEALDINPKLKTFVTSALKDTGMDDLVDYFIASLLALRKQNA